MENVVQPLAKSIFISLGLTAAISTADAEIQKILRFRNNNTNNVE